MNLVSLCGDVITNNTITSIYRTVFVSMLRHSSVRLRCRSSQALKDAYLLQPQEFEYDESFAWLALGRSNTLFKTEAKNQIKQRRERYGE